VFRESERPGLVVVQAHDGVLLLDAEPRLFAEVLVEDLIGPVPEVGAVGLGQRQVGLGLAEHHDVGCASEGVFEDAHGLEEHLGVVAGGLLRGGAVEVPGFKLIDVFDAGASVQAFGFASQL